METALVSAENQGVVAVWSEQAQDYAGRAKGVAPAAKAPAVTADIRTMVDHLPAGPLGVRDRALLLLGFAGAFRRAELVGLNVEDVAFTSEGATVTIRRSKTDQEGAGR